MSEVVLHFFFLLKRLQTLIPTEEELSLINDAKAKNPQAPLAQAESCLLTLGEISHLSSRLQLWAFALDYDSLERVGHSELTRILHLPHSWGYVCSGAEQDLYLPPEGSGFTKPTNLRVSFIWKNCQY